MAWTKYGKGTVLWSAVSVESVELYDYRRIFVNLLKNVFGFSSSVVSDAPKDVELTVFDTNECVLVHTVLLNTDYKARKVEDFTITIECDAYPKKVFLMPGGEEIPSITEGNRITFRSENPGMFQTYKIEF